MSRVIRPPFPYFGGKGTIAHEIWSALGQVENYIEPFFGSGAVLLQRPSPVLGVETVNDLDGFVANFWRAATKEPEQVAEYADWPVSELDMHARHRWLSGERESFTERLRNEPEWYCTKSAGWWCWGQSVSIMGNWLAPKGANAVPYINGSVAGQGVMRQTQTPKETMLAIRARMKHVRVTTGDFMRVLSPCVLFGDENTTFPVGVFLDPPYAHAGRDSACYGSTDDSTASSRTNQWCLENGKHPRLRIALAGYEGEHESLTDHGWRVIAWKAHGGMAHLGDGRGQRNKTRERLWFSPNCVSDGPLFAVR